MSFYILSYEKKEESLKRLDELYSRADAIIKALQDPTQELASDWLAYQRKTDEYHDLMNTDIPQAYVSMKEEGFLSLKSTDILNFDKLDEIIRDVAQRYTLGDRLSNIIDQLESSQATSVRFLNFLKEHKNNVIVFDY